MTTPLDTYREPVEKYRAEFDLPEPEKKSCWSDCFKKKPGHDRNLTRHEVDYTIMIRAKKVIEEKKI